MSTTNSIKFDQNDVFRLSWGYIYILDGNPAQNLIEFIQWVIFFSLAMYLVFNVHQMLILFAGCNLIWCFIFPNTD